MNNKFIQQIKCWFTFLFMICSTFSAWGAYAQTAKVTLQMDNVRMEQVMNEIEKQTSYFFIVNKGVDINRTISINVADKPLDTALQAMVAGTDTEYKIYQQNIYLSAAPDKKTANNGSTKVSGVVRDTRGTPVVGASVVVKGTTIGESSGLDGAFSLQVPAPVETAELYINFIGYDPVTVKIGTQTFFTITLNEAAEQIEDVVITALGIKRSEKALAYTVQQVKSEAVTTVKSANFVNSLAGKVAGAVINTSSSGVGGSAKVIMRGMKSIMQTSNVLYVIDGIPMHNFTSDGSMEFGSRGTTESIADMNPDDIESISVMTGAAAAALYGSDAANGAMLITTKKGKAGATQIQVSSNTEFMNPLRLPDFQTRYGTGRKGKASGSTIHSWGAPLNQAARYNYSPEDFLQTGHILTNSVTLSGGTEKNQIYFSTAAVNSKGLVPNNKYNRYNFTFRNTSNLLNDRLILDVSGSYIIQKDRNMINQGVYSNPLVSAYLFPRGDDFSLVKAFERWNPARKIYEQFWPQGEGGDLRMQNPYWIAYRNPRENSRKRYIFTGGITYKITDWMNVAGRIRVDNTNSLYTEKLYATSNPTLLENSKKGKYTETRGEERQTYGDVMLNLSKTFKEKFSLDAHIGASIKDNRFDELSVYGPIAGAPNIFNVVNLDKSQKKTPKTGWHEQTQSFFYSLELGWKSQLFVTTTGRNDWASQLANSPQKSFFYPSVGVSWLPSSTFNFPEKFNYLKIRASWASVANPFPRELTIATHPYDDTISGWDDKSNYPIGQLYPERTKTWELGFDARFLHGFTLSASWYRADTYNQTFNPNLSASSGYSDIYIQTGHVRNTGVEASLGYDHQWKNWNWNSQFTFSWNKNKIIELCKEWYNPITEETITMNRLQISKLGRAKFILKEGGSMGDLYSTTDLRRDDKGNIEIDEGGNVVVEDNLPDMKLGSVFPDYNLAWRNSVSWKNLNLGFLVTARIGGIVNSLTQANMDLFGVSEATAAARDAGGALVNGRSLVNPETWYTAIASQGGIPQYYTYSATNVRLQELSLGYTIPRKWLHNICSITVSFVGRNLWMMYCKAPFDPEAVASTNNFYQGMDYFMMPSTRNLGFNINIKF